LNLNSDLRAVDKVHAQRREVDVETGLSLRHLQQSPPNRYEISYRPRNFCPTKVVPVKTHLKPTFGKGRAKVVEVLRVLVGGDEEGDGSARVMRIEVDWETRFDGEFSLVFAFVN
jgi:hypothetical protein